MEVVGANRGSVMTVYHGDSVDGRMRAILYFVSVKLHEKLPNGARSFHIFVPPPRLNVVNLTGLKGFLQRERE